jgi:hypothetical protein
MKKYGDEAQESEGGDISKYLDTTEARRPEQEQKRVNVNYPLWMIHQLDKGARSP